MPTFHTPRMSTECNQDELLRLTGRKGFLDGIMFVLDEVAHGAVRRNREAVERTRQSGIFPRTAENQAAYISGWLSALKGDKRLLPIAAAQAQKAADFLLGTQYAPEEEAA